MSKVTVRVLKKSVKRAKVGETVEVSERDARVLEAMKVVERVESAPAKRTYQRRDLTAEE